jgi:hypothetical protein
MRRALLAVILALALATPGIATADELELEPRVVWSIGAGLFTALLPLAVGGAVFATHDDIDVKRASVYTMSAGLALAPVVSHLVAREWKRVLFGVVPLAAFAATVALLQVEPSVTVYGQPDTRTLFGLLLGLSAISSGVGLVDSLLAGERHKARVTLAPTLGRGSYGLSLGGSL